MKKDNLLHRFEYSIVSTDSKEGQSVGLHVCIDFNYGKFYLKGDWQFIVREKAGLDEKLTCLHPGNVEIAMNIFPFGSINLVGHSNDGLILFLKGAINDDIQVSPCTGMLVLSNCPVQQQELWFLIFYLYELSSGYCEIKLKLPVYLDSHLTPRNFK